jgi:hypothetical protein
MKRECNNGQLQASLISIAIIFKDEPYGTKTYHLLFWKLSTISENHFAQGRWDINVVRNVAKSQISLLGLNTL